MRIAEMNAWEDEPVEFVQVDEGEALLIPGKLSCRLLWTPPARIGHDGLQWMLALARHHHPRGPDHPIRELIMNQDQNHRLSDTPTCESRRIKCVLDRSIVCRPFRTAKRGAHRERIGGGSAPRAR